MAKTPIISGLATGFVATGTRRQKRIIKKSIASRKKVIVKSRKTVRKKIKSRFKFKK